MVLQQKKRFSWKHSEIRPPRKRKNQFIAGNPILNNRSQASRDNATEREGERGEKKAVRYMTGPAGKMGGRKENRPREKGKKRRSFLIRTKQKKRFPGPSKFSGGKTSKKTLPQRKARN